MEYVYRGFGDGALRLREVDFLVFYLIMEGLGVLEIFKRGC